MSSIKVAADHPLPRDPQLPISYLNCSPLHNKNRITLGRQKNVAQNSTKDK